MQIIIRHKSPRISKFFHERYCQSLKTSHALGAAAKVRSRARSVEFIRVPNSDDHSRDQSLRRQPAKETASGLSVMSELVVKVSGLLTDSGLRAKR